MILDYLIIINFIHIKFISSKHKPNRNGIFSFVCTQENSSLSTDKSFDKFIVFINKIKINSINKQFSDGLCLLLNFIQNQYLPNYLIYLI
jgi:hypothetical protein